MARKSKLVGRFRRLDERDKELTYHFRNNPTPAEEALWEMLRNKKLQGYKFRFQHKIGKFFVDFYCHAAGLIIEVDGSVHDSQIEEDQKRTDWLQSIGLKVIRFRNEEVLQNPEEVRSRILEELKKSEQG
jgi:5-methyltetrahydrofolate--homocysteine methyltransferase